MLIHSRQFFPHPRQAWREVYPTCQQDALLNLAGGKKHVFARLFLLFYVNLRRLQPAVSCSCRRREARLTHIVVVVLRLSGGSSSCSSGVNSLCTTTAASLMGGGSGGSGGKCDKVRGLSLKSKPKTQHKSGSHLFKELLNVYPSAKREDYMVDGKWQKDLMEIDVQLIRAHRAEALSLGSQVCPRSVRLEAIKAWKSQRQTAGPTTHGEAPPAPLAAQGVRGLSLASRPSPGGREAPPALLAAQGVRGLSLTSRPSPGGRVIGLPVASRPSGSRVVRPDKAPLALPVASRPSPAAIGCRSGPVIGSRAVESRIGTGAVGSPAVVASSRAVGSRIGTGAVEPSRWQQRAVDRTHCDRREELAAAVVTSGHQEVYPPETQLRNCGSHCLKERVEQP